LRLPREEHLLDVLRLNFGCEDTCWSRLDILCALPLGRRHNQLVDFMNLVKVLLVVAAAVGAYNDWREDGTGGLACHAARSTSGFATLPAVRGQSPAAVLVVAAEDCALEDAQCADRLADDLSRNGVRVVRVHHVGFDLAGGDSGDTERINAVMTGTLPIVFVRGRAKANPTLDEVLAEFRSAANSP
jgi:hypothetical protein